MTARALVVDDDATIRAVLAAILETEGLRVVQAGNGLEALAAVAAEQPDLIFMDLVMPEKDGIETIRDLRKQGNPAYIVAITAHAKVGERLLLEAAKTFGANEGLNKPFPPTEIQRIARQIQARAQR